MLDWLQPTPGMLVNMFGKPADLPWAMHLRGVDGLCGRQLGQIFLALAFVPYDAFISLDAIGRTLLRLLVTRQIAKKKSVLRINTWPSPVSLRIR